MVLEVCALRSAEDFYFGKGPQSLDEAIHAKAIHIAMHPSRPRLKRE